MSIWNLSAVTFGEIRSTTKKRDCFGIPDSSSFWDKGMER